MSDVYVFHSRLTVDWLVVVHSSYRKSHSISTVISNHLTFPADKGTCGTLVEIIFMFYYHV